MNSFPEKPLTAGIDEDVILSAIVEGATDGIARIDADGRIVSWTTGAERLLGYSREEIVGREIFTIVPEDLRDAVRAGLRRQIQEGGVYHEETVRIHKKGKPVPVLLTRVPLQDARGKTVAFLVIFKDISEKKKLQKQVETLQRDNAMAKVAAKVAHEIRNPLGVLFLKSDLMVERLEMAFENWGKGNPGQHRAVLEKYVSDIKRQISRLEEIANNYLQISKIRMNEREDVDLHKFMEDLEAELREHHSSDEVTFVFSVDAGLTTAYLDPQQFQRVFANLVRNSVEAIQLSHKRKGRIEMRVARQEGGLEFLVSDNGPGIPAKIQETIFDPFTTTKSIGTGLGLYLAREIVENHQGSLVIDSAEGQGTRVRITIPLGDDEAA
ncbi:MAG TPA: PAS domain S-box protein [bacterium]|nr:PAS domain S-box protein [bacterium]